MASTLMRIGLAALVMGALVVLSVCRVAAQPQSRNQPRRPLLPLLSRRVWSQ